MSPERGYPRTSSRKRRWIGGSCWARLSGLTRHNLVTAIGTLDGGSRFKITDLGATLVQVIRQAGPISQSGPESGA